VRTLFDIRGVVKPDLYDVTITAWFAPISWKQSSLNLHRCIYLLRSWLSSWVGLQLELPFFCPDGINRKAAMQSPLFSNGERYVSTSWQAGCSAIVTTGCPRRLAGAHDVVFMYGTYQFNFSNNDTIIYLSGFVRVPYIGIRQWFHSRTWLTTKRELQNGMFVPRFIYPSVRVVMPWDVITTRLLKLQAQFRKESTVYESECLQNRAFLHRETAAYYHWVVQPNRDQR